MIIHFFSDSPINHNPNSPSLTVPANMIKIHKNKSQELPMIIITATANCPTVVFSEPPKPSPFEHTSTAEPRGRCWCAPPSRPRRSRQIVTATVEPVLVDAQQPPITASHEDCHCRFSAAVDSRWTPSTPCSLILPRQFSASAAATSHQPDASLSSISLCPGRIDLSKPCLPSSSRPSNSHGVTTARSSRRCCSRRRQEPSQICSRGRPCRLCSARRLFLVAQSVATMFSLAPPSLSPSQAFHRDALVQRRHR